uniref:Galectin n=2 Tax=Steinernema glaseri TaxID=37863 RepID=A0A1I7YU95_9BILA
MYGDHHHHHSHHHKDDAFGQPFNRDGQDSAPYPDDGFGPVPHHPQHSIGGGVTMQHGSDSPYQPQLGGDSNYQPPTDEYGGEGRPPFPVKMHTLPVNVDLKQQIRPGETVKFLGHVHDSAKRFDVNFAYNYDSYMTQNNLIILHLSVRFDEKKIVMNTHSNGEWGKEERVSNPFKKGEPFDLRVRAHSDEYVITANHKEVHKFHARLPLQEIRKIYVDGDISLDQLEWGGAYHAVPYHQGFPFGHLRAGSRVFVSGNATGDFQVNLLNHRNERIFHFNPRFSEKKVVRNSDLNGQWGQEEREGKFPFHKNEGFDITIINEPYALQVLINDQQYCAFSHRTQRPMEDYVGLSIEGKVELTSVRSS